MASYEIKEDSYNGALETEIGDFSVLDGNRGELILVVNDPGSIDNPGNTGSEGGSEEKVSKAVKAHEDTPDWFFFNGFSFLYNSTRHGDIFSENKKIFFYFFYFFLFSFSILF